MVLLYGKCIGIVRNTHLTSKDENCQVKHQNWQYQLYKFENYRPEIDMVMTYLTKKRMDAKGLVMTGTLKSTTIDVVTPTLDGSGTMLGFAYSK